MYNITLNIAHHDFSTCASLLKYLEFRTVNELDENIQKMMLVSK